MAYLGRARTILGILINSMDADNSDMMIVFSSATRALASTWLFGIDFPLII